MAKVTVELRQVYQITVKDEEFWGDVLDNALKTYYTTGVEVDEVTLLSADNEFIESEGDDELGECDTCGSSYELGSREGRCGDCGDCAEHCSHETNATEEN
jgi:hypothetical protein